MISLVREEKVWSYGLIMVGIPAMVAGFIQGYRHNDPALTIGTIVVAIIILMFYIPALKSEWRKP